MANLIILGEADTGLLAGIGAAASKIPGMTPV
jgi:hypothetical protein